MKEVIIAPNSRTKYIWRFSNGLYTQNEIKVIDLRPIKRKKKIRRFNKDGDIEIIEVEVTEKRFNEYKKKMEHRIIQYSMNGEFIKVWDNAYQASESGADSAAVIRKVLAGKETKKTPNYQWRHYHENYPQSIKAYKKGSATTISRNEDTIEELSWDGTVIATYNGTSDAAEKSGCSQSYVCNVLAGKIKHPKHRFRRVG